MGADKTLSSGTYHSYKPSVMIDCTQNSGGGCELQPVWTAGCDTFKVPQDGWYQITMSTFFSADTAGNRFTGIVKNPTNCTTAAGSVAAVGGTWSDQTKFAPSTDFASSIIHTMVWLTTSDDVALIARKSSGSADLRGAEKYETNFTLTLLRTER